LRTLALLLLLANLLFLAWGRWVATPQPVAAPGAVAVPAGGTLQPIRLRGETGAEAATSAGQGQPNLLVAACVSIGPFAEPVQAAAAAAELTRLGYTSRSRAAVDEVRVGSWVHVRNLATPADAANALGALKAAGLVDASLVADPDQEGASVVSIGVYSDPLQAAAAAAAVTRAGFTAATADRRRTENVYWLDVDREANGGLPGLEAVPAPPAGGLPLELRACPADSAPPATTDAASGSVSGSATESSGRASPGG
jgi:hypothetical protein